MDTIISSCLVDCSLSGLAIFLLNLDALMLIEILSLCYQPCEGLSLDVHSQLLDVIGPFNAEQGSLGPPRPTHMKGCCASSCCLKSLILYLLRRLVFSDFCSKDLLVLHTCTWFVAKDKYAFI